MADSQELSALPVHGGDRKSRSRSTDFLIFIALPLLLTALAMMLGAGWLLNGIARSVNAQEETRTWQAVQAGVGALEDRLAGLAADNAHWDDATRETYGTLNEKWTYDAWGVGSADVNYDTMYLLAGDGRVLAAYQKGKPLATSPEVYLASSLDGLRAFSQTTRGAFSTLSTITNTPDGVAILTAAPVLPTSSGIDFEKDNPNLAIFISHLTPAILQKLGSEFIVDNLSIIRTGDTEASQKLLRDHWNKPVALASWTPRNPGEVASSSYRNTIIGVVLGLLGVLIPLTIVYFRRLTELEAVERMARHMAQHDQLTGLLNRSTFIDVVEQATRSGEGDQLALVLVEATNIPDINDNLGIAAGDQVIRELTSRLPATPGSQTSFARIEGGTFAIVYKGVDSLDRAQTVASTALSRLRKPVQAGTEQVPVHLSIGIATAASGRADASELIRRADLALSYARQCGLNQTRLYDRSLDISSGEDRARLQGGLFSIR